MNPRLFSALSLLAFLAGCQKSVGDGPAAVGPTAAKAPVFISVVNDMDSNPQAVDMALKFAGFAIDEGRDVLVFFTVKGVNVPLQRLPEDTAFQDNAPIKEQLRKVIERGAKIHVCPVCMKAHQVEADALMEGTVVTTRPKLFEAIRSDTAVFTF